MDERFHFLIHIRIHVGGNRCVQNEVDAVAAQFKAEQEGLSVISVQKVPLRKFNEINNLTMRRYAKLLIQKEFQLSSPLSQYPPRNGVFNLRSPGTDPQQSGQGAFASGLITSCR
jgi:hypothetical protein